MPAGTYLARALPAGVRDCESPNAIESEGALGEGKYQTLAITRNADGEPSLTPYADGAPSAAGGQVELSFAHALNEADYAAVKIEPMGLIVEAFKANQSTIAPDPLLFRVFHPDGPAESWFEPDAAMPLEAPFGYSVFLYMAELDATLLSAITCRNGPSVSVSPQPQGSRTCAPTKMVRRVIPYAAGRLPSAL